MGIVCNEVPLIVTKDIYEALIAIHSLRATQVETSHGGDTTIRYIWIDALCINQEDLDEKSHQVSLMRHIFARAEKVIVWLGQESRNASAALMQVQYIFDRFAHGIAFADLKTMNDFTMSRVTLDGSDDLVEAHEQSDSLRPLIKLYSHKWFRRIWIVQEIILARSAIVMIGERCITWEVIGKVAWWFFRISLVERRLPELHSATFPASMLYWSNCSYLDARSAASTEQQRDTCMAHLLTQSFFSSSGSDQDQVVDASLRRSPLLQILEWAIHHEATHPEDYIFALIGLCDSKAIKIDYSKTCTEIYVEVARYLLETEADLDVLSAVQHTEAPFKGSLLVTSWVPQWHIRKAQLESEIGWHAGSYTNVGAYSAASSIPKRIQSNVDQDIISIKGSSFDHVTAAGPKLSNLVDVAMGFETRNTLCLSAAILPDLLLDEAEYVDGQPALQALACCLTLGIDANWRPIKSGSHILEYTIHLINLMLRPSCSLSADTSGSRRKPSLGPLEHELLANEQLRITYNLIATCLRWGRLFRTSKGYIGVGPETMVPGDMVTLLFGGRVPFLLRQLDQRGYRLVGDCYVQGIMHGEAIDAWRKGEEAFVEKWFDLH